MWLASAPLKDFTTTFCLSFESFRPFKSLLIPWPLNLPKWQWRYHIYLHVVEYFYDGGLLDLLSLFLVSGLFFLAVLFDSTAFVGFTILHNPRYYPRFQYHHSLIFWYRLDVDMIVLFLGFLTYLFVTMKSLLLVARGFCFVLSFSSSVCIMKLLVLFSLHKL